MHCTKAQKLLQAYIDKQIPLKQLRELESHLSVCATCKRTLYELEEIGQALNEMEMVAEPANFTTTLMRRVAVTPQRSEQPAFVLHISLLEFLFVIALATIATLGVFLGEPSLRGALPFANGHDKLSLLVLHIAHSLITVSSDTLMLAFWVVGTILGVWITLALAGREMRRTEWFRSVMNRLPVR